jgi:hypothetical protein
MKFGRSCIGFEGLRVEKWVSFALSRDAMVMEPFLESVAGLNVAKFQVGYYEIINAELSRFHRKSS